MLSLRFAAVVLTALPASAQSGRPVPPPIMVESVVEEPASRTLPGVGRAGLPDFEGVLDDTDPSCYNGAPCDTFTFPVQVSEQVTVTMTSNDFDTYLIVRSPSGEEWSNDDFGSTRVSQVDFLAAEGGTYTIQATAYSEDARGAYEVRASAAVANVLETLSGRLDYNDARQIKGEYFDELTIQAPSSGTFYVELMPLGFNGFLRVTTPQGVHHTSEPYGGTRSLRVGPLRGERGRWTAAVTTMSPDEVGAYDVRVFTLEEK